MTNGRSDSETYNLRCKKAADLLAGGMIRKQIVMDLASEYNVSKVSAREYVRQGQKLLKQSFDFDDIKLLISQHLDDLQETREYAQEAGNHSAAVGAEKLTGQMIKLIYQSTREIYQEECFQKSYEEHMASEVIKPSKRRHGSLDDLENSDDSQIPF